MAVERSERIGRRGIVLEHLLIRVDGAAVLAQLVPQVRGSREPHELLAGLLVTLVAVERGLQHVERALRISSSRS